MYLNPKLAAGLFYAEKAGKHLFLNPLIPNWIVVNANGALILSKCDGEKNINEIAKELNVSIDELNKLFYQAQNVGVIDKFNFDVESNSSNVQNKNNSCSTLNIVHWKLTNACNLKCKYCYAESGTGNLHLSLSDLMKISHDIASISPIVEHTLSGGEPLLHPDCLEFADLLKKMGNFVFLLTNGTLINNSNANKIASCVDRVKISLDGSTEEIHAMTRGWGNYATINAAIDLLVDLGVNVKVAMTVHKGNKHDVEAMTERFGSRLVFQPLFQAGRGVATNELVLTGSEYYNSLVSVKNVAPMAAIGEVIEGLRGRGVKRCALADSEISISETGDVYPCQLLTSREFFAGNLNEKKLTDIYFNSPVFAWARGVSVDTLEKCQSCPIRLLCAGGCRARDFYEIGTIEAVGEFCEYEQQAFLNGLFDSVILE